jgi:GTP-binding protein EngB required for normal cell division
MMLACGVRTVFPDGLRYIKQNLQEYKVTLFVGVPVLIETIYKTVMKEIDKQGKTKLIKTVVKISNFLRKLHIDLRRVFLLVDYRHKPTEDDQLMYNFMKYYKLPVTIVATKFDKVSQKDKAKNDKLLNDAFDLQENDDIVLFSSVTKKGKEEIYSIIESTK